MKGIHTTVVCSFNSYTFDCIENRLIKTALWKIHQFINSLEGRYLKSPELESKIGFLLNSFNGIQIINPDKRLFKNLKQSVFYKEYTLALELAKIIFQSLGFDPFSPIKEKSFFVVPYYINMALLFELYVYKKLRERYEQVFYQKKIERYIPDFLVKDRYRGSFIADAKYKNKIDKEDLKQVSFYGRLRETKNLLGYAEKEETSLKIILPTIGKECKEQDYSLLTNVRIKYIPIPTR
jgi:5-methylcytosine-specific restriction endonuclease McrBC regulatory subunit McrC